MRVHDLMDFTLNLSSSVPFDLGYTLDSGQVFRWYLRNGWWYGTLGRGVVKVRQEAGALVCSTSSPELGHRSLRDYFRLGDDMERVLGSITKDECIKEAVQRFYGLRLIDQDVWECLVSFTLATNTNIPNIVRMLSALCRRFGEEVEFEGATHHLFPAAELLARATEDELAACGLGYRAKFVGSVARAVDEGRVNLEELRLYDYDRAREVLTERLLGRKTMLGIGPKVADCVLLFSCRKDSAFPIDTWIARLLASSYRSVLGEKVATRLGSKVAGAWYEKAAAAMRSYFGEYAGYAQQYLYHYSRNSGTTLPAPSPSS